MDKFTRGYIECIMWSSTDDEGDPLDMTYIAEDIAPEALKRIIKDCQEFQAENADLLSKYYCYHRPEDYAGHDFWLTRNGHGAWFRDRGLGAPGEKLSTAARTRGSCDIYVGDDGRLYV